MKKHIFHPMKGQGLGIIFAILTAWIFAVLMLSMFAASQCSSTVQSQIQNTPKGLVADTGLLGQLVNGGAMFLQGLGYFIGIVGIMFAPCSGIPFWLTSIVFFPMFSLILIKIIGIARGGG